MVPLFDDQTLSWQPKIATKEFNAVSFWSATLDGYFIGGSFFLHIRCTSLAHYNLCNRVDAFVAIFWTYSAGAQKMQGKMVRYGNLFCSIRFGPTMDCKSIFICIPFGNWELKFRLKFIQALNHTQNWISNCLTPFKILYFIIDIFK